MTINSLQINNSSTVITGLGTQTANIVAAGLYTIAVNLTIPYRPAGTPGDSTSTVGASALAVVVNQNGSPILTLAAPPSPTQPSMSGSVSVNCAANDAITVVLTSSAAADNALNAVKGTVNVYAGK